MKGKQNGVKAKDKPVGTAYAGGNSNAAKALHDMKDGFKSGGKAKKSVGKAKGVMSSAHAGRMPRKSGGSVMSSAASGIMRPGFSGTK